jgi:hypothetical protein
LLPADGESKHLKSSKGVKIKNIFFRQAIAALNGLRKNRQGLIQLNVYKVALVQRIVPTSKPIFISVCFDVEHSDFFQLAQLEVAHDSSSGAARSEFFVAARQWQAETN